jgi:antitoxin CcdA
MRISYAHRKGVAMRRLSSTAIRQPASLSIDAELLSEAKALDVNISRAAEAGIAEAVAAEKSRLWLLENRAAIETCNEYVERNGLPLAKHRMF